MSERIGTHEHPSAESEVSTKRITPGEPDYVANGEPLVELLEHQDTRDNTQATTPASAGAGPLRWLGAVAVCVLLAAALLACAGGGDDSAGDERVPELEAKVKSLEESLAALRQEQQLDGLEEAKVGTRERLDDMEARLRKLEGASSKTEDFPTKEQWSKDKGDLPVGHGPGEDRQTGRGLRGRGPLRRPPRPRTARSWSCPWSSSTARPRSSSRFTASGETPPTTPPTCLFTSV